MNLKPSLLSLPLALALPGCMHFDTLEDTVSIETHARDWRDEVIYQVLIDRFADGNDGNNYLLDRENMARYHGGDWVGLEQQLDYIEQLGVTTLKLFADTAKEVLRQRERTR